MQKTCTIVDIRVRGPQVQPAAARGQVAVVKAGSRIWYLYGSAASFRRQFRSIGHGSIIRSIGHPRLKSRAACVLPGVNRSFLGRGRRRSRRRSGVAQPDDDGVVLLGLLVAQDGF